MVCSRWSRVFVKNFTIFEVSSTGECLSVMVEPQAWLTQAAMAVFQAVSLLSPGRLVLRARFRRRIGMVGRGLRDVPSLKLDPLAALAADSVPELEKRDVKPLAAFRACDGHSAQPRNGEPQTGRFPYLGTGVQDDSRPDLTSDYFRHCYFFPIGARSYSRIPLSRPRVRPFPARRAARRADWFSFGPPA